MNRRIYINPVAKSIAHHRRRTTTQVVKPKKGKGSYDRNTEKGNVTRHKTES
jgi:stalled ribosome alternative rescue factor ArfA